MAREISLSFALGARLTSGYSAAFRGAAAQAGAVARAVREMERTPVGRIGAAMQAQRENIRGLRGDLRQAQAHLEGLRQRAEAAGTVSVRLARQIEQAERQVRGLSGALSRQAGQYRETVARAADVGGSVRELAENYRRLSGEMTRARNVGQALAANSAQADALRTQRADLQSRLLGTAMTGAAVALPVTLAISAEDTFADLRKVMDAPESVMQQVFADAQAMSTRTGKSFEDVVTIMTAAAQAGLGTTREQLLGVADQAVKMSIAWGVSAEQAGKSLATWQAAMGMTAEESRHTADVINALSNAMNAEAGEIDQIFTRMGPLMRGSGFAAQDVAALATAFKAAGAEVEVSGTAMKNFVKVMAAGEAGLTDERMAIYRYLQIDPNALQKELQTDAKGAVMRVLESLQRVRPEERNSIMSRLFGEESVAAITPLMTQIDTLRKAFQIANSDVSGSVDQEYANRMKTTATAISQLSQGVRNLGVTVGTALLPVVGTAARFLSGVVGVVSDLARRFPRLTATVAGVAAGIGMLAVGSLALGLVTNVVRTGINGLGGALLQMAAGQITAANGTRTLTLWQRAAALASLSWRDAFSGLGGGISRLGQGLAALIGWQRGATLSTILLSVVQRGAAAASAVFSGGLKIVGLALRFALGPLGIVLTALTVAAGLIIDNWSTVGPYFRALWGGIVGVFQWGWDKIRGIIDAVAEGLAWIGKKIDETPILGSAKRGLSKGFNALFGGDEDAKKPDVAPAATAAMQGNAAPNAVSVPELPSAPGKAAGLALPEPPDMPGLTGTTSPDIAGTGYFDQSFNDFMAAQDKKKPGKGTSRSGGSGRGSRAQGGPVTVVTLAGDNARPQTLFIPAYRAAGSGAGASLMATGGPRAALPRTPALLAGRKEKAAPAGADESGRGMHVELHQQFGLVGDPRAVRRIMESLKPDFEQLVRRALDKLASDRRRTAYAQ
ncbi:phage tail tape measure protein [uncultured Desulfovibrio sp.]|uniref:phage tail tape measure protein n=1 Tax=uncultured Desulfovibrio sp. TaxID=167968 RepID=UPI00320A70E8